MDDTDSPSPNSIRRQYQQRQQQEREASSTSSFGTGAEPERDAKIAAAWLSGSTTNISPMSSLTTSGVGGGSGTNGSTGIFGSPSGRMPSYRQSNNTAENNGSSIGVGLTDSYPLVNSASQQTYDDSMPYDADDGLGDYEEDLAPPTYYHDQQGGVLSSLVVPNLHPSTIDEETKEEILSDQDESGEIENWLSGIHRTRSGGTGSASGSGEGNIAENKIEADDSADGATEKSKSQHPHRSLVRWLSESSEMSVNTDDEDYYTNEQEGDEDGESSDDSNADSSRKASSKRKRQDRFGERRSMPKQRPSASKLPHSPSAASMATSFPAERQPVQLCGVTLPLFLTTCPPRIEKPSWNRVSSYVVRHAPCFWCGARLETSATDRAVLGRLNVLCAIFAIVQGGSGLFLFTVQKLGGGSPEEEQLERQSLTPNLWSLNGMVFFLGLVGIIIFFTEILTLRVIREVNLVGCVRYMWSLYWLVPIEILLVVSLFDYHRVTDVWIRHWWLTPSFDWFRQQFCLEGTANTECTVPIEGGAEFESEDEWCSFYYNVTTCSQIKLDAQKEMAAVSYVFLTANAIWGLLLVCLLCLALRMLEGIITAPIVQSSKQANIPLWLSLPCLGCLAGGATLLFSPSSAVGNEMGSEVFWVGVAYFASGGSFLFAVLLGWFISTYSVLNSRDKLHKQIAVSLFIVTMVLTIFILMVVFAASLVFSVDLVDYGISDEERGNIACYVDTANSCTNCYPDDEGWDPTEPQCPEWTLDDVVKVLQTQLKQSATLAAIFLIYAFSALRFGFVLRSHVSRYQIEYV